MTSFHTSSSGLISRIALSCSFAPSNAITQFGLQSWFNRDRLRDRANVVGGRGGGRGVREEETNVRKTDTTRGAKRKQ